MVLELQNYKKIKRMSLDEMARFISSHMKWCDKCPARKEMWTNCNKESDCFWTIRTWLGRQADIEENK